MRMVERVAEAMWKRDTGGVSWHYARNNYAPEYRARARAAIAAMREPTEEMLRAGWDQIDWEIDRSDWESKWTATGPDGETSEKQDTEEAWRAMIDAALQE